jgi:hypothetical protein
MPARAPGFNHVEPYPSTACDPMTYHDVPTLREVPSNEKEISHGRVSWQTRSESLIRCLDPRATVGPSLFRVTSRGILRTTSVNGQK